MSKSSDSDTAILSITQGAGLILFGTFLQLGIAFFAKVIMARFLTLEAYGVVSLGIITLNLGATIALLGFDTGVARFLPRTEEPQQRQRVVSFSYTVSILISLTIAVLLYFAAVPISHQIFETPDLVPILRVMAIGIPFWVALDLGVGVTRGLSETAPRIYSKNVILPLSRFVLVAVVILAGFEAIGVAGAYVASYSIAAVFLTYLVTRRVSFHQPITFKRLESRLTAFSIPLTFSNLSSLLYRNVDLVLLGFFWTTSQVAIYNVVYPLARLLRVGTGAFGFLFVPTVSSLHADGKMDDAMRVHQVTTKWILLLITPIFAVLALFPEMSIKILFGAKYIEGALTLVLLAVSFYATNVTGLSGSLLTAVGRSKVVMMTDVSSMVFNVLLNLAWIPQYGFLGAGAATGITYLGRDAVNTAILYRETGIHPFTSALIKPAIYTTFAVLAIYLPVKTYLDETIPLFIGLFVLFLAIYAVMILRFGGVEREDVMMFNQLEDRLGADLSLIRRILAKVMP